MCSRFGRRRGQYPAPVTYRLASAAEPPGAHFAGRAGIPPADAQQRRFEFQVMPQLLNFLGIAEAEASALDFGTIAIYSCSASCALEPNKLGSAYAEEFAFVQPATEGVLPELQRVLDAVNVDE
jgi:Programmed cell death protein 2, C-terminal putative domain